jgi:hypothetical protein
MVSLHPACVTLIHDIALAFPRALAPTKFRKMTTLPQKRLQVPRGETLLLANRIPLFAHSWKLLRKTEQSILANFYSQTLRNQGPVILQTHELPIRNIERLIEHILAPSHPLTTPRNGIRVRDLIHALLDLRALKT